MDRYGQLVTEAYAKLKVLFERYMRTNEKEGMCGLLHGFGAFAVKARPDVPHNYQAVIDAVHEYYSDSNKNNDIIDFYYGGIQLMIQFCEGGGLYDNCMQIFMYQLKLEKTGKATFRLEMDELLQEFGTKVEASEKWKQDESFVTWVKRVNATMKEDYGCSFLSE